MLETARDVRRLMSPLTNHLPNPTVVGQAAIAGALDPALLSDAGNAQGAADYIARRLDALVPALERGWQGRFDEERGSLVFERTLRGVLERIAIDGRTINPAGAPGRSATRRVGKERGRTGG